MSGLFSQDEYVQLSTTYSLALGVIAAIVFILIIPYLVFVGSKAPSTYRAAHRIYVYLILYALARALAFILRAAHVNNFSLGLHSAFLAFEVIGNGFLVLAIGSLIFWFVNKAIDVGVDAYFGSPRLTNIFATFEFDLLNHLTVIVAVILGVIAAAWTTRTDDKGLEWRARDFARASPAILLWCASGYLALLLVAFFGLRAAKNRGQKSRPTADLPQHQKDADDANFVANVNALSKTLWVPLVIVVLLLMARFVYLVIITSADPLIDAAWSEKAYYPMTVLLDWVIVALLTLTKSLDFLRLKP